MIEQRSQILLHRAHILIWYIRWRVRAFLGVRCIYTYKSGDKAKRATRSGKEEGRQREQVFLRDRRGGRLTKASLFRRLLATFVAVVEKSDTHLPGFSCLPRGETVVSTDLLESSHTWLQAST